MAAVGLCVLSVHAEELHRCFAPTPQCLLCGAGGWERSALRVLQAVTQLGTPQWGSRCSGCTAQRTVTQCCCTDWFGTGMVQCKWGLGLPQFSSFSSCSASTAPVALTLQSGECYVSVGVKAGGFCAEQPLHSELHAAHVAAAATLSPLQRAELQRCCWPHGLHGAGLVLCIPAAPGLRACM